MNFRDFIKIIFIFRDKSLLFNTNEKIKLSRMQTCLYVGLISVKRIVSYNDLKIQVLKGTRGILAIRLISALNKSIQIHYVKIHREYK